jgi:hypothetical protein
MTQLLAHLEEYLDPVKYKLILKSPDESETTFTYDSFNTANAPFTLTDISTNLGVGATGDFSFTINDTKDKVITNDVINCGAVAIIQAAKKQQKYKNIMYGIIDEVEDSYPAGDARIYNFRGLGFGVILNYTILNFVMSANKEDINLSQTILTDPNFSIDKLAIKAFTSTDVLPIKNSPLLKDRGGFNIDSIANSIKVVMPGINNPQATAATILENFAATSGTVLYIDPDKKVFMRPPYAKHSGITIRQWEINPVTKQPMRLNDPADTTSYYMGGWSSRKFMKVDQGFFNRVFLTINTDQVINQAPGEATENFTSLSNKDIGVQFLPGSTKLTNIALLLSKVGTGRSSVEDAFNMTGVNGIICEDNGQNQPGGKIIATFTIPYDSIDTGPTPCYKLDLNYKVGNIDQNKPHWILLFKTGIDEENTVRWFHDTDFVTDSSTTVLRGSATKRPFTQQPNPDKVNFSAGWGTSTHGPVYRYSFFLSNRTTIEASDPISIRNYTPNRPIEIRVNAPWIQDIRTGFRYANTLLQYGAKLKKLYEKKQLTIPDKLFFPLEIANVVYPPAGLTANSNIMVEINNVRYSASAYNQENPFGSYFVELSAVGYVNHYQKNIGDSILCS